jgi:type IV pilus assembly protein PilQ
MKRTNWFIQHGMIVCLALGAMLLFSSISEAQTTGEENSNKARVVPSAATEDAKKTPPAAEKKVPAPAAAKKPPSAPPAPPAPPTTKSGGADAGNISSDGTFTGYYQDTDLRVVLRQLSMLFRTNIVASKDVSGRVTVTLYDVTFEEALDSVLRSSGLGYLKKGKFIYIHTLAELAAIVKATSQMKVRTFKLDYVTAVDAQGLIKPAMSPEGTIAATPPPEGGITASAETAGDNSHATSGILVVSDFPKNLERVAEIIKEIDIRPQQILIEATILSAKLTENNNLGVNFNIMGNTDFATQGTTDGLTNIGGASPGAPSAIPPADLSKTLSTARTDFSPVTGGITFGFVTDSVSVFLRALEQVTDVTVLANPKLLVVNKQKGEVIVGSKDGYVTTVVSDGVATQSIEFLESGTRLVVRPYIGRDGYIRMMIHPEDSDGGVQITDSFTIPSVTTTEVTSNVLVRDGRTIVIGGLFRESTTNNRSQVPVIGSIPYLGTLFGSTLDATERREVMVLMTPHIVKQEEFEDASENMKDDVERFRVGARKGMQWWAADRLARSHLNWAREHLKNGKLDKARWDLDMALVRRPTLIEAIEMRENLTDKAYWAEEARQSTVNNAIERILMFEMGKDFRKVVTPVKPRDYILPFRKGKRAMGKKSPPK